MATFPESQIDAFFSMLEHEKINFLIDTPVGMFYYSQLCSELLDKPSVVAFLFEDLVGPEGGLSITARRGVEKAGFNPCTSN